MALTPELFISSTTPVIYQVVEAIGLGSPTLLPPDTTIPYINISYTTSGAIGEVWAWSVTSQSWVPLDFATDAITVTCGWQGPHTAAHRPHHFEAPGRPGIAFVVSASCAVPGSEVPFEILDDAGNVLLGGSLPPGVMSETAANLSLTSPSFNVPDTKFSIAARPNAAAFAGSSIVNTLNDPDGWQWSGGPVGQQLAVRIIVL